MTEPLTDDQVWGCAEEACFCGGCAFYVTSDVQSGLGYCTAVATGPLAAVAANEPACEVYKPIPGQKQNGGCFDG